VTKASRTESQVGRWVALVVFLVALTIRLLWITVPLNTDETLWVRRAPAFYGAMLDGNPADTFLKHHPGVPGMWVTGAGIIARYELRDWLPADRLMEQHDTLRAYLRAVETDQALPLGTYVAARVAAALVTSAAVAGFYVLSRRLFSAQVALLATIFLLFEPFFVAYQRSITTDAFQTNFTWLSFLAFLLYLDGLNGSRKDRGWLVFSGVMFGLAVMSKVSAVMSGPAFLIVAVYCSVRGGRKPTALIADLGLWGLSAMVTAFLLWPALQADLPGTIAAWRTGLEEEVDGHLQFFFDAITRNPGPAYYPVVLLFRLSPLLLVSSALGVIALIRPAWRKYVPDPQALWAVVLFIVVVIVSITAFASKIDRYIQPLLPGLALLAGAGIWAAVGRWHARNADRGAPRLAPVALVVLACQLAVAAVSLPYYLTYFNPLLGGARVAQKVMMIGNGELMDRAGAWAKENAPQTKIASWMPDVLSSYYGGPVLRVLRELDREYWSLVEANYVVLYIKQMQRDVPAAVTQYFRPQRPVYTVARNGVEYATVYPGPSVLPDDAALLQDAERLDFGGSAQLVGRQLETPLVAAGEDAGITVYWQPTGPFEEPDTRVLMRVVDAHGRVWG
jgi:4-amino-4-deoxy-L-arabinose transferase-like glycosyltransferase